MPSYTGNLNNGIQRTRNQHASSARRAAGGVECAPLMASVRLLSNRNHDAWLRYATNSSQTQMSFKDFRNTAKWFALAFGIIFLATDFFWKQSLSPVERNALSSAVGNILFLQWIARTNPRHYLHSKMAVFFSVGRDLAGCMACYCNLKRLDSSLGVAEQADGADRPSACVLKIRNAGGRSTAALCVFLNH
jgi:hypothetical protein